MPPARDLPLHPFIYIGECGAGNILSFMNLEVEVQRTDMYRPAAWYLQFELVQTSFPEERTTKSKRRTDLCVSGAPVFETKIFLFEGVSLANRLELKVGAIEMIADTLEKAHHLDQMAKVQSTSVQGLFSLVFTQKMLSHMRDGSPFTTDCVLRMPKTNEETGHVQLKVVLEFTGREEQFIEDDRLVRKCEFDEYEKNAYVMQEKLDLVTALHERTAPEVEKWVKQVDDVRNALRSLGADLVILKKEKERLEAENDKIRWQIGRLQKIEELPVLIDMLDTPSGVTILRQKYATLEKRYEYERRRYEDLKTEWLRIEGKQGKVRRLQEQIALLKEAESQARFHLRRCRDMLPATFAAKEMVQSQDSLISALESKLRQAIVKPDPAMAAELADLKFEKAQLTEKNKQILLMLDANNGMLPLEMLEDIKAGDEQENREELARLRVRGEALIQQVMELGEKVSHTVARETRRTEGSEDEILGLQVKLQAAEVRVMTMQEEMDAQAVRHAREVATLAAQLAVLEARVQHKDMPI